MTWRAITAALLTGGSLVPTTAVAVDDGSVLTFLDRRITESSGLVDRGSTMVTTNDSGSRSRLFVVSTRTGRTVGVTDYRADVVDVEALAPAGAGAVWVGDIGDNGGRRRTISVYRVPVGVGNRSVRAPGYRLAYPRGSHDAESLLADRQGHLYVITKSFAGGIVYRAPVRLSRTKVNRLQPVGRVVELATDAALMPDGRHVLVRGLGAGGVYTFPGLRRLGGFPLPRQRQGEAISVGPGNRIRLSTEGARTTVRQVRLPPTLARRTAPPRPSPSPSATPSTSPSASPSASPSVSATAEASPAPQASASSGSTGGGRPGADLWRQKPWLMWSIPGVIGIGALGIGLGLRRSKGEE